MSWIITATLYFSEGVTYMCVCSSVKSMYARLFEPGG